METARSVPFGPLLRRHRDAASLTQQELAERARLSVHCVLLYLRFPLRFRAVGDDDAPTWDASDVRTRLAPRVSYPPSRPPAGAWPALTRPPCEGDRRDHRILRSHAFRYAARICPRRRGSARAEALSLPVPLASDRVAGPLSPPAAPAAAPPAPCLLDGARPGRGPLLREPAPPPGRGTPRSGRHVGTTAHPAPMGPWAARRQRSVASSLHPPCLCPIVDVPSIQRQRSGHHDQAAQSPIQSPTQVRAGQGRSRRRTCYTVAMAGACVDQA